MPSIVFLSLHNNQLSNYKLSCHQGIKFAESLGTNKEPNAIKIQICKTVFLKANKLKISQLIFRLRKQVP